MRYGKVSVYGLVPRMTGVPTRPVAASIVTNALSRRRMTYAVFESRVKATPYGAPPTVMAERAVRVRTSIGVTVIEA